ncbi:MAG: DUF2911 domain-containing protein [Bacteroidota bacterium]
MRLNKYFPILIIAVLAACKNGETVFSNNTKSSRPSPPASVIGKVANAEIKIDYSSPAVRERKIWGDLVPYDRIWRTGANEATTIAVSKDVIINGENLPKGKYSLFTIPGPDKWVVIINKDWDLWGSYDYKESKDALRLEVKPYQLEKHKERMTFEIDTESIEFKWEKLGFELAVKAN